jgi:hypothetical protein
VSELTRRELLAGAIASACAATAATQPARYAYLAESYSPVLRGSPVVLGVLLTNNPQPHLEAIRELRRVCHYRRRLVYHGSDRFKIGFVRQLMQYFVRQPDLRFVARMVHPVRKGESIAESLRVSQYSELAAQAGLAPGVTLRCKRPKPDWGDRPKTLGSRVLAARIAEVRRSVSAVRVEEIGSSAKEGLLELTGALNGVLLSSWIVDHEARYNAAKSELPLRLRNLLALGSLTAAVPGKWELVEKQVKS